MQSPSALLRRHGLAPKRSWGQNFLGDERSLEQIASAAQLQPGEVVVELGAGLGHLTRFLAASGARVVAVERDRDLVRVLEGLSLEGVRVVEANAARLNLEATAGTAPVVVVGNLPYHLTSPILFEVLAQKQTVSRAVFTLQKEVAHRLGASPGGRDYGLLAVLLGLHFSIEKLFELSRHLFHPPPKVDSAVIRLRPRASPVAEIASAEHFTQVVKAAFAHRRKTLLNSLKFSPAWRTDELVLALRRARIEPERRAETLSLEEFAALERALAETSPGGPGPAVSPSGGGAGGD